MVASLIAGERRLNGAAVLERARRGVGGLEALGVREGEVVAAMLRNDIAFLEATMSKPALVTHEVEKILGRPAETFADAVSAHQDLFIKP